MLNLLNKIINTVFVLKIPTTKYDIVLKSKRFIVVFELWRLHISRYIKFQNLNFRRYFSC